MGTEREVGAVEYEIYSLILLKRNLNLPLSSKHKHCSTVFSCRIPEKYNFFILDQVLIISHARVLKKEQPSFVKCTYTVCVYTDQANYDFPTGPTSTTLKTT